LVPDLDYICYADPDLNLASVDATCAFGVCRRSVYDGWHIAPPGERPATIIVKFLENRFVSLTS
jgi:hypothetical protein